VFKAHSPGSVMTSFAMTEHGVGVLFDGATCSDVEWPLLMPSLAKLTVGKRYETQ
jgi:hypothetical protein